MTAHFNLIARALHWLMAVMIVAMLFIGITMATSLAGYGDLVAVHRPLGIAILALAVLRVIWRFAAPPPPLPAAMPALQRRIAQATHVALYALMIAMPLVGWAMLSAASEPVTMLGGLTLPPIVPHDRMLYAALRGAHGLLAVLLLLVFLAHMGAALLHALIIRDGVFQSMTAGRVPRDPAPAE